jgi:uncharacterized membrane protein (UPF0127 family)
MSTTYRLETSDGSVVANHVEAAEGVGSRFMGLMFRAALPEGHGLVLRPCSSIHMFFMRFALDAVFVDGEGTVVRVYANLKPWRATGVVRKAKACLELPAGTIARAGITLGDRLRLTAETTSL